jgi:hypothetical protein
VGFETTPGAFILETTVWPCAGDSYKPAAGAGGGGGGVLTPVPPPQAIKTDITIIATAIHEAGTGFTVSFHFQ